MSSSFRRDLRLKVTFNRHGHKDMFLVTKRAYIFLNFPIFLFNHFISQMSRVLFTNNGIF